MTTKSPDGPMDVTQQGVVQLYGREIVAVRLEDGRIAATLSSLCEALQLLPHAQARRIRADDVLRDQLVPAFVATAGGRQSLDVLTAWAIPTWLSGIKVSRVAEEKQPAILAFRREAADALYRHFSQPRALEPAQPEVPSSVIERPMTPAENADPAEWIAFHRQMARFLEWQMDVERWRGSIESRLESVEEVARLVPEILERLGPETLSHEHQETIKNLVGRLHDLTGASFGAIYGELNRSFHVGTYKDIREIHWGEVAAWFKKRIDSAAVRSSHA